MQVGDNTTDSHDAVITALGGAADWRYSPRWLLESWDYGSDVGSLATARACIAGWADERRNGLIVFVYGSMLHGHDGVVGVPSPLHSYLLCATRSGDGTDSVGNLHRLILSCPGEDWCHRGGCPSSTAVVESIQADALLTPVMAMTDAIEAAERIDTVAQVYEALYGASMAEPGIEDTVLYHVQTLLADAGWVELERSTWEGGLEELLVRRGQHCLTAAYDPATRQIQLADGKPGIELLAQILAEEGAITGDDGAEIVDRSDAAAERWGTDTLAAVEDLLHGRIVELLLKAPVQITILGLHPHADGSLLGPESSAMAEQQLATLLRTAGPPVSGD